MLNVSFDMDELRSMIREEVKGAVQEVVQAQKLPPLLTRTEMMGVLRIGHCKAAELIARPDFPVFREAGLLFPTDKLFEWVDRNTRWMEDNSDYFKAV